ncbi:uncharacterized protein LOC132698641 [Cylas formicarius]|uniref:uncharacterized protein LOC132698641 n=1 Tax=Cylas formicarius TaxID=197179 RepID=UPI0029587932|nr:uncharacterized protein LOC132698641 [Cylas formicarius]
MTFKCLSMERPEFNEIVQINIRFTSNTTEHTPTRVNWCISLQTFSTAAPRPLFRVGPRRRNSTFASSTTTITTSRTTSSPYLPTATKIGRRKPSSELLESQVTTTQTPTPINTRFKFVSRKNVLRTAIPKRVTKNKESDQTLESSNQQSQEKNRNSEEIKKLADVALALQSVQSAPAPGRKRPKTTRIGPDLATTRAVAANSYTTAAQDFYTTSVIKDITISPHVNKKDVAPLAQLPSRSKYRYSSSSTPLILITTPRADVRRRKPSVQVFDKINAFDEANTYRPLSEYDYYDDLQASILSRIPEHSKVLVHSDGRIECLDQGNFPHPVSCKKFISCAKMENGKVIGWEYTCPKNLSFDPIGGMCNWSAGLGCVE